MAEGLPFDPSYLYVPTCQPWAVNDRVCGDGAAGLPWTAAGVSNGTPHLPNAEPADASHFRICIHEGWGSGEAMDLLAALKMVEGAYRR